MIVFKYKASGGPMLFVELELLNHKIQKIRAV